MRDCWAERMNILLPTWILSCAFWIHLFQPKILVVKCCCQEKGPPDLSWPSFEDLYMGGMCSFIITLFLPPCTFLGCLAFRETSKFTFIFALGKNGDDLRQGQARGHSGVPNSSHSDLTLLLNILPPPPPRQAVWMSFLYSSRLPGIKQQNIKLLLQLSNDVSGAWKPHAEEPPPP